MLHLAGDFLLQTSAMAERKSSSTAYAALHSFVYTLTYSVPALLLFGARAGAIALVVIGGTHFVIDRFAIAAKIPALRGDVTCPYWVVKVNDAALHLLCNCAAFAIAFWRLSYH